MQVINLRKKTTCWNIKVSTRQPQNYCVPRESYGWKAGRERSIKIMDTQPYFVCPVCSADATLFFVIDVCIWRYFASRLFYPHKNQPMSEQFHHVFVGPLFRLFIYYSCLSIIMLIIYSVNQNKKWNTFRGGRERTSVPMDIIMYLATSCWLIIFIRSIHFKDAVP